MNRLIISVLSFTGILIISCTGSGNKKDSRRNPVLGLEDLSEKVTTVKTKTDWEKKREQILESMQHVMGPLPVLTGLPEFDLRYADEVARGKNFTRFSIDFLVTEGERLTAYLYIPDSLRDERKNPAMIALHETDPLGKGSVDGQGENRNLGYARELAERGYIVIAPDYPGFGDMKDYDFENDRYESGTMKGIFDHIRCVDLLQSMNNVDPEKIGVIGHSLGGHNAIFAGVFDTRLKIVVSSCGWTGFNYYDVGPSAIERYGSRLGPWAIPRYMPLLRDKYNADPDQIPFDFNELIAAIAPRVFFSNSPVGDANFSVEGVRKGIEDASVIYKLLGVPGNLQVYYPDAQHDFPFEIRMKAYEQLDKLFR